VTAPLKATSSCSPTPSPPRSPQNPQPLPAWEETVEEAAAWDRRWGERDTDFDRDEGE